MSKVGCRLTIWSHKIVEIFCRGVSVRVSLFPVTVTPSLSGCLYHYCLCSGASLSRHRRHPVSVASVSVTPSPSPSLCRERLCHIATIILSLLWASLSPHHHLPVSVTDASVTMSLSFCLCCGCLSHPITVSRLYRGHLYHPVTVTLSLLRVHLSPPSPSLCLYRRSICRPATHAVFVTVSLSPLSLSSCHNHDVFGTMFLSSYHC